MLRYQVSITLCETLLLTSRHADRQQNRAQWANGSTSLSQCSPVYYVPGNILCFDIIYAPDQYTQSRLEHNEHIIQSILAARRGVTNHAMSDDAVNSSFILSES